MSRLLEPEEKTKEASVRRPKRLKLSKPSSIDSKTCSTWQTKSWRLWKPSSLTVAIIKLQGFFWRQNLKLVSDLRQHFIRTFATPWTAYTPLALELVPKGSTSLLLQSLPPEIISIILNYLDARGTETFRRVSKWAKTVSESFIAEVAVLRSFLGVKGQSGKS